MLNIEEAIASYEKSAERYHKSFLHCKSHGGEFYQEEAEANKICYEHDRQLAAWLRELQERRKEPEIIHCTECKHYREYDSKYVKNAVVVQCMADRYPISEIIPDGWFCAGAERRTDD